jgi:hypothetical protein
MREIEDIHIPFLAWLNELQIPRVYHRPDQRSGIQRGWPDFTVAWMSHVVFIEAKTPEGRLSKVQENVHAFIRASGNRVVVCRSVEECKEAVKNILCELSLTGQKNAAPVLAEPVRHAFNVQCAGEARESNGKDGENRSPRGGVQFFIGNWNGNPYVFAPDLSGAYRMIRQASAFDRLTLPNLPA